MLEQQIVLIFFQIHLTLNIELLVGQRVCICDAVLSVIGIRNRTALIGFAIINLAYSLHRSIAPRGCAGILTVFSTHEPDYTVI